MANPIYHQFGNKAPMNPMLQRFLQFKKSFNGNPQEIVQNMINSGRISQDKVNQFARQADALYEQFKQFM